MANKQNNKKKQKEEQKREGNLFDKIFKENIEPLFTPLAQKTLGLDILSSYPLNAKLQTTV